MNSKTKQRAYKVLLMFMWGHKTKNTEIFKNRKQYKIGKLDINNPTFHPFAVNNPPFDYFLII